MLAVAILAENGNAMGTRIALTLLSTETALGIAIKRIIDALLEACKNLRPSEVLQSPYQLRLGSTWEHDCLDNSVLGHSRRALSRRLTITGCVWLANTKDWQVCTRC